LAIERRSLQGDNPELLPPLAADLVRRQVAAIVAIGSPAGGPMNGGAFQSSVHEVFILADD
jgi:hypothetical protein